MGRLPSPAGRKYQVKALNDIHRECIRLTLLGWKSKQIADFLGVTEPTVCNAVNGSKGQMQLAIMRGARDADTVDIAKDITEFAAEAWEIAKDLIRDANQPTALRLKYCFETVGIAGHVKPQRIQMSGAVAHLTTDEITSIKERARLLACESGIVDAEYRALPDGKSTLAECEEQGSAAGGNVTQPGVEYAPKCRVHNSCDRSGDQARDTLGGTKPCQEGAPASRLKEETN